MSEHQETERRTALVVDDEPDSADIHAEYLAENYTVRTVYAGEEALEALDADVDVVLLDRKMPGRSGDEVATAIHNGEFDPRVVLVTGMDPEVETLNLPFDDYLVKPASGDEIRDAVDRMIVRNNCDETIQGIVALASKMATLESKMSVQELESSSVYATLQRQLAELRESSTLATGGEDDYVEFTDEKLASLLG